MLLGGDDAGDFHIGLRTNVLGSEKREWGELALVEVVLGKNQSVYSVHVRPSSYTTHGVQRPHLLTALGFRPTNGCKFMPGSAFCRPVAQDFGLVAFADAMESGYGLLLHAGGALEACGYEVDGGGGARFMFARPVAPFGGDGHMGAQERPLKVSEDGAFKYVLTWIENPEERGWVTHYAPKAPTPSLLQALTALAPTPPTRVPRVPLRALLLVVAPEGARLAPRGPS